MFQDFAPFYGPEDLDNMSAAFDAVWYQLCIWVVATGPLQRAYHLAQVILAAACTGQRNRERLKNAALRALSPVKIAYRSRPSSDLAQLLRFRANQQMPAIASTWLRAATLMRPARPGGQLASK